MTNPILTELAGLSPSAKKALVDAHVSASAPQDINAGMQPAKIPTLTHPSVSTPMAPPIIPQVTAPMQQTPLETTQSLVQKNPTMPSVTLPQPGTLQGDKLERARLLDTGSGVHQIKNPWLKGIAGVGNVIGGIVAPGLMSRIPGTEEHHQLLLNRNQGLINQDESEAQKEAQTGLLGSERGKNEAQTTLIPQQAEDLHNLQQAQIGNYQSEAYNRLHPQDKFSNLESEEGLIHVNDRTGEAQHVTVDGKPVGAKIQTIVSPPTIGEDGKPHSYLIEKNTGRKLADLGEHYERPMQVNVNAGNTALDREAKQYGSSHQKALDAGTSQLEKIEDARSMINGNAESQALGIPKVLTALVSGQGSGVRITQPELNAIAKARGLSGDVEGTLNNWAGEGKLTDEQKRQLTGILDDVKNRITQKIQIHNDTLDRIGNAGSREDIIKADKDARHQLTQLESGGDSVSHQQHKVGDVVNLKGKKVTIKKIYPDGTFDY